MSENTLGGVPLVHYPKLSSGPVIDDERWLPANRRPPTHVAIPVGRADLLAAVVEASREFRTAVLTAALAGEPQPIDAADLVQRLYDALAALDADTQGAEHG